MFRNIKSVANLYVMLIVFVSCQKDSVLTDRSYNEKSTVLVQWADLTLEILKKSYNNTPTYSSRTLSYMGVCMYECVVNADSTKRSLNGQLSELNNLPKAESGQEYNWIITLNEGQRTLLKLLYPKNENLSEENWSKIDVLAEAVLAGERSKTLPATIERSIDFGRQIALTLFDWSKHDGGFEGFKYNFDSSFSYPLGPGFWVPPVKGQSPSKLPLHPFWGSNKSFVVQNHSLVVPNIEPYSSDTSSLYYKYHKEVFLKGLTLTPQEKEIAAWWGDDPSETFSPPGHSYNLVTIAVKQTDAEYLIAAEAYARVGLAVADGFIHCWKSKYAYLNQRPSTFIRENISVTWEPFWPEPPFPAFPSGHALQAAAAATVLTEIFGNNFSFVDNSHQGRVLVGMTLKARNFKNFWQFAEECAYSRLMGGIHTRQDNLTGLAQGKKIGQNVNMLLWKK